MENYNTQSNDLKSRIKHTSPSENTAFNDSHKEFDKIIQQSQTLDQNLKVHLERNRSLIERLFPNSMQKLIEEKHRILMVSSLDVRLSLFKIANDCRIEATRDKLDGYLKAYKGENRAQLTEFLVSRFNQLVSTVKTSEWQGIEELIEMHQYAETIPVASLKEKYIAKVKARESHYLNVIEQSLVHFQNVFKEHLGQHKINF